MNFSSTISASALLHNIVGDDSDYADLNDESEFLRSSREWGLDIEDEYEDEQPTVRAPIETPIQFDRNGKPIAPFVPKVAGKFMFSTCNDFECPICMEPFHESESGAYALPCGHKYCKSCVQTYVNFYAGDNLPLKHKVSVVTPEGDALTVTREVFNGVTCPNQSCQKVFRDELFERVLDEKSLARYFEIREAQFRRVYDEEYKTNQARADRLLASWSLSHQDIVRLCPHCYTQIEKNGGCENMNCTKCFKHFIWPHALRIGSNKSHWLSSVVNPETSQGRKGKKRMNNRV